MGTIVNYISLLGRFFLWALALGPAIGQSQVSTYSVSHYTTENGLPQNSVKDIRFDKSGFCWLATEMGAVRFDGRHFRTYASSDIKGLVSDRVQCIAEGVDGEIQAQFVGDKHLRVETPTNLQASFLTILDKPTKLLSHTGFLFDKGFFDSLTHGGPFTGRGNSLMVFAASGARKAYFFCDTMLYYVSDSLTVDISPMDILPEYTLLDGMLMYVKKGNHLSAWKDGVPQVSLQKVVGDIANNPLFLSGNFKMVWCKNGSFIYCDKALYRLSFDGEKISTSKVLHDINISMLKSVCYDPSSDTYFLGSGINGLYVIRPSSFYEPPAPAETDQNFYAQSLTTDGRIVSKDVLFSTNGPSVSLPINSGDGDALYIDDKNHVYFEYAYTLFRHDLGGKKTTIVTKLDSRCYSIRKNLYDSSLVICTESTVGILRNDEFLVNKKIPFNLRATGIEQIDADHFLLKTQTGLHWYSLSNNSIYRSLLDSLFIRAVYQDGKNRLWIGSYGKGFFMYENGKLSHMPYGPNQALKTVHAFIDDHRGYFWLPTNNGLFKVKKEDLVAYANGRSSDVYFYMFNKMDGLTTNEFNGGCDAPFLWTKDSMLSVSSLAGLVWFYPNQIALSYPSNGIYMDDLHIDGKGKGSVPKKLVLPSNFGLLSFYVICPYFGNKENLHLTYNIEGLNDIWQDVPDDGLISINNIPSGEYHILIKKSGRDFRGRKRHLYLVIEVLPPFYRTWWFYIALVIILVLVGYLIVRYRLKGLRKKARSLQREVLSRTAELADTIARLETSETALLKSNQIKDNVITMVLHDLRSPIRFLNTISNHLATNHSGMDAVGLKKKLSELRSITNALNSFTDHFFLWATSQHENFKIKESVFMLQDLFKSIKELYIDILSSNGNTLIISSTNFECRTDYDILSVVLRNLIDNANKNTRKGNIAIGAFQTLDQTTIYITDSGRGLTPQEIEKYMDENHEPSDGVGSWIVLSMLRKIDGRLDIKSRPGNGSTFSVTLSHLKSGDASSPTDRAQ